jgi:hypothetical protein
MERGGPIRNLTTLLFACILPLSLLAPAQTVRPLIVEYVGAAHGKFELVNNSLKPINVVLEPRSFRITEDGDGVYGPLNPGIHLKLSAMSVRIPPQQGRFVFYEVRADTLPAWCVIYSVFAQHPPEASLNIEISLPHTIYMLQKQSLQRQDVSVESFVYDPNTHRVVVMLANHSANLGRAVEWQVKGPHTQNGGPGFPLLPGSRRRLEASWDGVDPPITLAIRFQHFTLKEAMDGRSH